MLFLLILSHWTPITKNYFFFRYFKNISSKYKKFLSAKTQLYLDSKLYVPKEATYTLLSKYSCVLTDINFVYFVVTSQRGVTHKEQISFTEVKIKSKDILFV
jgi:hypothetical protein